MSSDRKLQDAGCCSLIVYIILKKFIYIIQLHFFYIYGGSPENVTKMIVLPWEGSLVDVLVFPWL